MFSLLGDSGAGDEECTSYWLHSALGELKCLFLSSDFEAICFNHSVKETLVTNWIHHTRRQPDFWRTFRVAWDLQWETNSHVQKDFSIPPIEVRGIKSQWIIFTFSIIKATARHCGLLIQLRVLESQKDCCKGSKRSGRSAMEFLEATNRCYFDPKNYLANYSVRRSRRRRRRRRGDHSPALLSKCM